MIASRIVQVGDIEVHFSGANGKRIVHDAFDLCSYPGQPAGARLLVGDLIADPDFMGWLEDAIKELDEK